MKRRRVFCGSVLIVLLLIFLNGNSLAGDKATREECEAKVKEAVALIENEGTDAAFRKIMDPNGPFVWKDSYVFCIDDKDAKMLAHPAPRALGFPFLKWRSPDGEAPFEEILEVASSEGKGWKSYMHLKLGETEAFKKTVYFQMEPESRVIVGAGYYHYE